MRSRLYRAGSGMPPLLCCPESLVGLCASSNYLSLLLLTSYQSKSNVTQSSTYKYNLSKPCALTCLALSMVRRPVVCAGLVPCGTEAAVAGCPSFRNPPTRPSPRSKKAKMTVRIPRSATSAAVDAFALRPLANLLSQLQLSCQGRQAVGVHPASTAIRTRSAGQHRRDCAGSASGSARRTARQQNRYTHWQQQLLAPPLGFPLQTCRRGYATAGSSSSLPPQGTAAAAAAAAAGSADGGPAALYERKVQQGLLRRDEHQLPIVAELQELYEAILQYRPPPVPEPMHEADGGDPMRAGFLSRLFGRSSRDSAATVPQIPEDVPKSVYLFGDVGCGKSMLMDLLYESLPASVAKRRVHFHAVGVFVLAHRRTLKCAILTKYEASAVHD